VYFSNPEKERLLYQDKFRINNEITKIIKSLNSLSLTKNGGRRRGLKIIKYQNTQNLAEHFLDNFPIVTVYLETHGH
jgi:hypothetical protein